MLFAITGGAGFVGSNLAERLLSEGHNVRIIDDLSRPGGKVVDNLNYLRKKFASEMSSKKFEFVKSSVANFEEMKKNLAGADVIYHLAAQTAVTTSIKDPVHDFATNAAGSFNVLEAARQVADNAALLYTSTNKVYGNMQNVKLDEKQTRYEFADSRYKLGISEDFHIDPESPYGCSKYAADSYFLDYHRTYGMKTVVFRCSCMYGEMQKSLEDQGWISWLVGRIINGKKITIYGDGKQIRDILHIADVTEAVSEATKKISATAGQVFNIGGGEDNSISLLELMSFVQKETGKKSLYEFADWRLADQKVYISNTEKAKKIFGWQPGISKEEGIRRQIKWESTQ
ncbi:MAG: GDP-mannose 4,6-dehydratase [Candidatus Aenigmarchaeota archaeon]|nr:GDP-mannose 4,6-dehydratase [Candidatus Aenigmarchaeota archaeon]